MTHAYHRNKKILHRIFFFFFGLAFFSFSCSSHSLSSECEFMSVHFSNEKDKSTKLQDCTNASMKKYIWIIKALFYERECVSHCHKNTALVMTNSHFFINCTSWTFINHNATFTLSFAERDLLHILRVVLRWRLLHTEIWVQLLARIKSHVLPFISLSLLIPPDHLLHLHRNLAKTCLHLIRA